MDHNKDRVSNEESRNESKESRNESKESEEEVQEIKSTLIIKPKTKLAAWNFFHIKRYNDGCPSNANKLICSKCLEPVAASYGNASNLFNYLGCKHPLVYAQVHDKKKSKRSKKVLSSKGAN